jgi:hypothetical protein
MLSDLLASPGTKAFAARAAKWAAIKTAADPVRFLPTDDGPDPENMPTKGFTAPACHDEFFAAPMSYSAHLADANLEIKADGTPRYKNGKAVLLFPQKASPGTFASRGGKLRKSSAIASIKAQRWFAPEGEAHARRMDRFTRGWIATKAGLMTRLADPAPSAPVPKAPASIRAHWELAIDGTPPECGPPLLKAVWHSGKTIKAKTVKTKASAPTPPPQPEPAPMPAFKARTLAYRPPANPTQTSTSTSAWGRSSISIWESQHDLRFLGTRTQA